MDAIRIGFVGLGGICRQRHVPGFANIEGVAFAAVNNRSRASSEAAAREFHIPVVCDSWKELVARNDIDVVVIGTWPYMHHPVSIAALAAGKHVFCQARMAMNYAEAAEMCEAARRARRVAALCPVPFGMSIDQTVRRMLHEGALGDVRLVRVQSLSNIYADPGTPMNWRKDHRLSGLNMMTLGMYIEVIHRWLGRTCTVTAQTQIFTPRRADQTGQITEVKIPDQILFNTEMERGTVAQYVISGMARCGHDSIEIYGTKESLLYDVAGDCLYRLEEDGGQTPVKIRPEDAYDVANWRVERDFIEAIRDGREYHPDFEDGRRYMQVIQAVYNSADSGRTVRIEQKFRNLDAVSPG